MRKIGLSFSIVTFLVIGCSGPTPDDLIKKSLKQWDEAASILEGVTDEDSLRYAATKLETLAQRMIEANKQAADMEMSPEQKEKILLENRDETKTVLKRFKDAEDKVKHLPGAESTLLKFKRMARRTY